MELHQYQAATHKSLTLPWEEVLLMPVSDTQHGAPGADLPKLARHIKWGVKHKAIFTDVGDSIDLASPTSRRGIEMSGAYEIVHNGLDYYAEKLTNEYMEAVEPSRGRWLFKSKGHHLWKFKSGKWKGYDSDDVIADFLGCPTGDELGAAITEVTFRTADKKRAQKMQVYQWHGNGNGGSRAGVMNKIEKLGNDWETADVILMGHFPFKLGWGIDKPRPHFGKKPFLRDRRRIYACTGGFARGYQVGGAASYAERAGMGFNNIGGVVIRVRPVHEEHGDRLDFNVET